MLSWWFNAVAWLSAHLVAPLLGWLHLSELAGDPDEIAGAILIGLLQVAIIVCVLRPLETLAPAERWPDRRLTRIDRLYTLIMLLGLNPLFAYLVLLPLANWLGGGAEVVAAAEPSGIAAWFPWFQDHPLALFGVYYLIYDCFYYWMHRMQHILPWWWALHSMHHSQRQVGCWNNDRGSYVDGFIQSILLATLGLAIGVEPEQFAFLMLLGELVQNLSHTNVRLGFGRVFERLFVDPRFHRLHHMLVDPERPNLHNCNFGQVLSVWDNLFGTALYGEPPRPTGVGDPMVDVDNERGFWAMQWGAFRRFWGAVWTRAGWTPGDVAFDEHYRPIPVSEIDLHQLVPPAPRAARSESS